MASDFQLLLTMGGHVAWTAFLYCLLTIARAPTVWGLGRGPAGENPFAVFEPRISANLSNQFEWPVFFYASCVLFLAGVAPLTSMAIGLAWIFLLGRVVHSSVQILTNNIRLRGVVFTVNFVAVLGLWGLLLWSANS